MARYRSVRAIAFSFIARVAGSRLKLSLLVLTCGCCMGIYVLKRANREPPPKINFVHPCVAAIGRNVTHQPGSEYVSSQLEESWLQSSLDGSAICNMSLRQWQEAGIWTGYSKSVFRPGGQPAREPTQEEASVLSSFSRSVDGVSLQSFIEPLHGMARHPMSQICGATDPSFKADTFDITYLVTENACGRSEPKPIVKYYDLGCTDNGDSQNAFDGFKYDLGVGLGPSIPLFFQMYKDRCLEFDEIFAWEVTPMNVDHWWQPIPDHIRHRVHFYNIPVAENPCPLSLRGPLPEKGSFLRLLMESAKPSDFVVVKVDIDHGPELEIVEALAERPELAQLVDELYFEYHFDFPELYPGWGPPPWNHRTVNTALDLLHRLRLAGIRSHFWI
mmetsp:Transcript_35244/g.82194  ORF Transcript_35244/g.82194 Transcript_35244/m.82194 type:complete len:388 (+) Transcript_35244:29-1192(+)